MRQLVILSGKGGTGKTTLAAAFIKLSKCQSYADCDVDAPNLHLLVAPEVDPEPTSFYGMNKFFIDPNLCLGCGRCQTSCRYEAISQEKAVYKIDSDRCEGCAACTLVCPAKAIGERPHIAGDLLLYKENVTFSTAKLRPAGGNSGLLVASVKKRLVIEPTSFSIIDGSPGIGCPVIASLSGADMVLLVTEPTLSGLSDLKRIVITARHFHPELFVVINKVVDTSSPIIRSINQYCAEVDIPIVGMIPYDSQVSKQINIAKSIIDIDTAAGRAIRAVFEELKERIISGHDH